MNQMTPFTNYRADSGQAFKPRTGFSQWFLGNPASFRQVPKFSPEIMQNINELLGGTFQGLQNPSQGFEPFAQQARNQFETQTVPSLAERFTSMGGGQRSSAFQNALGSAGAGLEQGLATGAAQYGLQNREGLLGQLGMLLKSQPEFKYQGRQGGILNSVLGPIFGEYSSQYGGENAGNLVKVLMSLVPYLV